MATHPMRRLMQVVQESLDQAITPAAFDEAVVDTPQATLCDIFTPEGKLKDPVRQTVLSGIETIKKQFPQAKLLDFWMVGATVTYQYSDTSDIDTTLVYDPTVPSEVFDQIWDFSRNLEKQIPDWMGKRPYQFTPQKGGNRNNIPNADGAFDPENQKWIKMPPQPKELGDMYHQDIADPSGVVRKTYDAAERSVQPGLQRLADQLQTWVKSKSDTDWSNVMYQMKSANTRYASLKSWRGSAYSKPPTTRPSQNWHTGNLIYKMFDREGYHEVYEKIKKILAMQDVTKQQQMAVDLSQFLAKVVNDEIGYVPESRHANTGAIMDSQFFRTYADIIQTAHTTALQEADAEPMSQADLTKMYASAKTYQFIKNTPVALVPFKQLDQIVGAETAEQVKQLAGAVDKTSYDKAYQEGGYVVFQWNSKSNEPDIYIASPNVVQSKYVKFTDNLPTDAKARSKIPSLTVLQHLNIDAAKIPFYVKVAPVEMIKADDVGLAGKTIHTNWGQQEVQAGGYLVREDNGHIYTVAPDAKGLPIGYIAAN